MHCKIPVFSLEQSECIKTLQTWHRKIRKFSHFLLKFEYFLENLYSVPPTLVESTRLLCVLFRKEFDYIYKLESGVI